MAGTQFWQGRGGERNSTHQQKRFEYFQIDCYHTTWNCISYCVTRKACTGFQTVILPLLWKGNMGQTLFPQPAGCADVAQAVSFHGLIRYPIKKKILSDQHYI